ncbi:MAG: peptidase M28, partial [Candidatus Vecturithrix sp.]|nr:peptidase M28 [Candidatus Vecturithrix sp.]
MDTIKDLLARLSTASGTPGNEGEVRAIIREELAGVTEFSYDHTGSIICRKHGGQDRPKVMLAGHTDEVGFLVRLVTDDGFVKFHNLGGWWG